MPISEFLQTTSFGFFLIWAMDYYGYHCLYIFYLFREEKIIAISNQLFCTSNITHPRLRKYLIVPDELRPTAAITTEFIHTVKGVTVYATASFPSGHTATAFVFYFYFFVL